MRTVFTLLTVTLSASLLTGCGFPSLPDPRLVGLWGKKDVPIREVASSGISVSGPPMPPDSVFRSKQEAQDFITRYNLQERGLGFLETLDYDREIGLLALHASPTTCGDVEVAAVDDEGDALVVHVVKRNVNGLCGQMPIVHTHFVAIAKTEKPIRFATPLVSW